MWHISGHGCAKRNENIKKLILRRVLAHLYEVKPWGKEAKDNRKSRQVRSEAKPRGLLFVVAYSILGKEHPRRLATTTEKSGVLLC